MDAGERAAYGIGVCIEYAETAALDKAGADLERQAEARLEDAAAERARLDDELKERRKDRWRTTKERTLQMQRVQHEETVLAQQFEKETDEVQTWCALEQQLCQDAQTLADAVACERCVLLPLPVATPARRRGATRAMLLKTVERAVEQGRLELKRKDEEDAADDAEVQKLERLKADLQERILQQQVNVSQQQPPSQPSSHPQTLRQSPQQQIQQPSQQQPEQQQPQQQTQLQPQQQTRLQTQQQTQQTQQQPPEQQSQQTNLQPQSQQLSSHPQDTEPRSQQPRPQEQQLPATPVRTKVTQPQVSQATAVPAAGRPMPQQTPSSQQMQQPQQSEQQPQPPQQQAPRQQQASDGGAAKGNGPAATGTAKGKGPAANGAAKGKGPGKAGGKGGPPPPPAASGAKGAGAKKGGLTKGKGASSARKNTFVSLHWKVLARSPGEEAALLAKQHRTDLEKYLEQWKGALASTPSMARLAAEDLSRKACFGSTPTTPVGARAAAEDVVRKGSVGSNPGTPCAARLWDEELSRWAQQSVLLSETELAAAQGPEERAAMTAWASLAENPSRWCMTFSSCPSTPDLPLSLLEKYFKVRESAVKMRAESAVTHTALIDGKRLQMLGITLQKHIMRNRGDSEANAVLSLKQAVLRCDYTVVRQEALSIFRGALRAHAEDGGKISAYVREHGEDALKRLQCPDHHRLIYELLKVPQIEERLDCMIFETAFTDALEKCEEDLAVLRQALDMITSKRGILNTFFTTAHRLGQSLNRDSRAPAAPRGFALSTLQKLASTKSTRSPKHSVLHFVVALMRPADAERLFSIEDVALLARAKAMRSNTVYEDCMELVQGFQAVRDICETGNYRCRSTGAQVKMVRRRITLLPSARPASDSASSSPREAPIDVDDRFHEHMALFVRCHAEATQRIATGCCQAFQLYKDLAVFFDDGSVYPPPKTDQDPQQDLLAVLHGLAEDILIHRQEVLQDSLRDVLFVAGDAPPPAGGGLAKAPGAVSEVGTAHRTPST